MRVIVYVDGLCVYCLATAKVIRQLNWLGRITVLSFRDDNSFRSHGLTMEEVATEMHAVLLNGDKPRIVSGYPAVLATLRQLPLTWPLFPLFWLFQVVGLGPRLYKWLAENRIFVSDGTQCTLEGCRLPQTGGAKACDQS